MTQTDFKKRLSLIFAEFPVLASAKRLEIQKQILFAKLYERQEQLNERSLIRSIRLLYQPVTAVRGRSLKLSVFSVLSGTSQPSFFSGIQAQFSLYLRKAIAMTFSLALIGNFFLIPFASDPLSTLVHTVRAAYIACSGTVLLNDALCNPESLTLIRPGDSIATDSQSEATLVYSDASIVRLDKTTIAALDQDQNDQIHVVQGSVWLNTNGDGSRDAFTLSMPDLRLRLPQGSASVTLKGRTTQLLTTTSAVEVQIDRQEGVTELVAVAPEKKLTVRQNRARATVRTSPLDSGNLALVKGNHLKDDEYLDIIRKKFPHVFENKEVVKMFDQNAVGPNAITRKLLESYRAVSERRSADAQNALLDIVNFFSKDRLYSDITMRGDLVILSEIEQESPSLTPLVKMIRGKMMEQLRLVTIKTSEELVGNSISGMAYRSAL